MRKEIKTYETALISLDSAVCRHLNALYASVVYPEEAFISSEIKAVIDYYKNIEGETACYGLSIVADRLTYIKAWAHYANESIEIEVEYIRKRLIDIKELLHKIDVYYAEAEPGSEA